MKPTYHPRIRITVIETYRDDKSCTFAARCCLVSIYLVLFLTDSLKSVMSLTTNEKLYILFQVLYFQKSQIEDYAYQPIGIP